MVLKGVATFMYLNVGVKYKKQYMHHMWFKCIPQWNNKIIYSLLSNLELHTQPNKCQEVFGTHTVTVQDLKLIYSGFRHRIIFFF